MSFQDEGYFDERPNGLSGSPTPNGVVSDELRQSLKTLHHSHYDTIDGADDCETAIFNAEQAILSLITQQATAAEKRGRIDERNWNSRYMFTNFDTATRQKLEAINEQRLTELKKEVIK